MGQRAKRKSRAVSLGAELRELGGALQAVHLLLEAAEHGRLPSEEEARAALPATRAVLALVRVRLRDLRAVVRGVQPPEHFWAPHNAAPFPAHADDDPDVRFPLP